MTKHDIICRPSAFKHNVSEADIKWAFNTAEYDLPMGDDDDKHLLLGFSTARNLLEIMYNELDDGTFRVFHAMRCQKKYIKLLNH